MNAGRAMSSFAAAPERGGKFLFRRSRGDTPYQVKSVYLIAGTIDTPMKQFIWTGTQAGCGIWLRRNIKQAYLRLKLIVVNMTFNLSLPIFHSFVCSETPTADKMRSTNVPLGFAPSGFFPFVFRLGQDQDPLKGKVRRILPSTANTPLGDDLRTAGLREAQPKRQWRPLCRRRSSPQHEAKRPFHS